MSALHSLREFIVGRLSAAAEEIFSEIEKTIVRYEEERRLLDMSSKPRISSEHTAVFPEPPQLHVWKEEQEEKHVESAPYDPDKLNPPSIKEEEEQLQIKEEHADIKVHNEERAVVKELTDMFIENPTYVKGNYSQTGQSRKQILLQTCYDAEETPNPENSGSSCEKGLKLNEGRKKTKLKRPGKSDPGKNRSFCEVCAKSFSQKYIALHMRTHTSEKPFLCKLCGKGFCQKRSLKIHWRIHTGEKPFRCEICGATFSYKPTLTNHVRTHTEEKPFRCETCGIGFIHKITLDNHIKTHTAEKPYTCHTCGKGFIRKISLKFHIKTHTGDVQHVEKVSPKT